MQKNFSLGLDIGTNSIGWAVVDEDNKIVEKNKFALWGVRMFDQSKAAADKRGFRNSRRRNQRRKERILLLRNIFEKEISLVDPTFFRRLDNSFYYQEDKKDKNYYNLFNDSYTDKDFYEQFPTIFHLREHLLKSNEKEDIRFIYLALHHMIKFRGNFLSSKSSFEKSDTEHLYNIFNILNESLTQLANQYEDDETYFQSIEINDENFIENLNSIINENIYKSEKKKKLYELFSVDKKTLVSELIIPLLLGDKVNLSKLTLVKENGYEKIELCISDENFEEQVNTATERITELSILLENINLIKVVDDHFYLLKVLGNNNYLCESMVNIYDDHEKDLAKLKKFIKKYLPLSYNECFKKVESKLANYPSYIGMNNTGKRQRFGHCKKEDFYLYIKKLIENVNDASAIEEKNYFLNKINNGEFLLRQNSNQNGSFPMQLNLLEIEDILSKQSKHYSFLNEKDENSISNKEKIIEIFKYKLPYYVGPLNTKSPYSWVVRTNEKIYPWNYKNGIINFDETIKKFIMRMQNKCTYLKGENDYCLPKKSILYSEYCCLQYLNRLNINGSLISVDLKQELFNEVFLRVSKPTKRTIIQYLKTNYGYEDVNELPEVNCDMSSYIKLKDIFGKDFEKKYDVMEDIILDITIFEDKAILENRLINLYQLDSGIVKKLKGLDYKGYGNLSKHLLNDFYSINNETGEIYGSIIDILRKSNMNLQQILFNNEFKFNDAILNYNKEVLANFDEKVDYKTFINENIYTSPIMKRALIQSYRIIKEVEQILGTKINKFYIECTRYDGKKEIKKSRYQQIKDLFNSCKNLAKEYQINMAELNKHLELQKDNLKSDKLYLYFTQLGRSMYSLKPINIEELSNNRLYDIDHIYPQSLIKDDSLSNRVLVFKSENEMKLDKFTFDVDNLINPKAYDFYKKLLDIKLISKEKYKRLTKKEINNDELDSFVNRQLVATNQAVIGLINLLKLYDGVEAKNIIYSKASVISDFRNKHNLYKSRIANNFHHAHDAYLNVVIGRAINTYYTINYFNSSFDYIRMKNDKKTINPDTILNYDRSYKGKKYWELDKTLNLIKHNLYNRFDVRETKRTYNSNELFSKIQLTKSKEGSNALPIKGSDNRLVNVDRYGGYPSDSYCKYVLISTMIKNSKSYILEPIPKRYDKKVDEYLQKIKQYVSYEILVDNIMSNVVCEYKKRRFCITGVTNNDFYILNMKDRYFNYDQLKIIKKIEKYFDNLTKKIDMPCIGDFIKIYSSSKKEHDNILSIDEVDYLAKTIKELYTKDIYRFSEVYNNIVNKLDNEFTKLALTEKVYIINELLKLCKTNERLSADLVLIDEASKCGVIKISKKLKPGMKLLYYSLTGYYKQVLFEVPSIGV